MATLLIFLFNLLVPVQLNLNHAFDLLSFLKESRLNSVFEYTYGVIAGDGFFQLGDD